MAADVKWIKIVVDIFDDEKILLIEAMPEADSLITIWFKLLCLAGKQNNSGVFMLNDRIAYTDEMFATIFRRKLATVRLALSTFENLGMIEIINGAVTIPNWGKHQNLDAIESRRVYMRNYMQAKREAQRLIAAGKPNCKPNCKPNGQPTVSNADIDKEKDVEKETDKSSKRKRFTAPTVEEVKAYCTEQGYGVDAQRFVDYYESKGWTVGKDSPMKDWRAAVRNWQHNDGGRPAQQQRQAKRGMERENFCSDWAADIMNRPRG